MTETLHDPTPDALRARLLEEIRLLDDRGFLSIGEPPDVAPAPAKGLRGRLFGRRPPSPNRYVQTLRLAEQLSVECVGATSFGGPWEIGDATDKALRALGLLAPGDADYEQMGGPSYRVWVPVADAERAADIMASALELLGATEILEIVTGP